MNNLYLCSNYNITNIDKKSSMRTKKICIRDINKENILNNRNTPMLKKNINICVFNKSTLIKSVDVVENEFKNLELNHIIQDLLNESLNESLNKSSNDNILNEDSSEDLNDNSFSFLESQPITDIQSSTNITIFDSLYRCFKILYNYKTSIHFTEEFNLNIINDEIVNNSIRQPNTINKNKLISCEISRDTIINEYILGHHIHLNSLFSDYCDYMDKNLKITIYFH